ncbi:hypothetical protein [Nocardia pseudobrasiliensis]|uniref:Carboxypeptidase family protein n=1 Tax=Nocardia pseudobrasiliensis TaxID=45979 RepID=A0A370I1C8_9NOCA|nr:hypothetical protein [Nocardia pseudobrasiliensis]RDI64545.1 hypothetical protein DFR76_108378 [Nocardia pseudobrasiliensis]
MRPAVFVFSALAAWATTSACASDNPPAPHPAAASQTTPAADAPEKLTVQAGTGTERFPVPGVAVRITSCANDTELATITTGRDGNATQPVAAGCYRATVTTVPSGCQADEVASDTADVKPGEPATVRFLIHCA